MKKRMLLTSIRFSTIVIATLLFSSFAISAGLDDIEKFSPLSEQNKSVLTRDENITSFIQQDGQLGTGYRCGTLPPTVEQAEAVQQAIDELRNRGISQDISCTVNIPVAFHILRYDDGVTGDVTDSQINDQITVLNNAYASTNFQFVLDSIERVNNTTWSLLDTGAVENTVKQALAISPATTLNFYTCTSCMGYLGWAYFPDSYPEDSYIHGVVVLYSSLPGGSADPYDEGDTGTHEVGHYLGLYHTFEGGCTSPGDYIDDTPYEASPAFGCPVGRDTCPAAGLDPIENFMDYSDDACMIEFTANQSARTDSMVETYKPSLISSCDWTLIPGRISSAPALAWNPVASEFQMVVQGVNNNQIWASTFDSSGTFNNDWTLLSGRITSAPAIAWNPVANEFQMVVRHSDSTIWTTLY